MTTLKEAEAAYNAAARNLGRVRARAKMVTRGDEAAYRQQLREAEAIFDEAEATLEKATRAHRDGLDADGFFGQAAIGDRMLDLLDREEERETVERFERWTKRPR